MSLNNKNKSKPKRKREQILDPVEEETRNQRLEAIKRKRKETMETVKRDLEKKFQERKAIHTIDLGVKNSNYGKETSNERGMIKIRSDLKSIFEAGVDKVNPINIIREKVQYDGKGKLSVNGMDYNINNNIYIVGWGKETIMLGATFEKIIGDNVKSGWLVVPEGTISRMWSYHSWLPKLNTRLNYVEAVYKNGFLDEKSIEATNKIVKFCSELKQGDILVVILSGGADELMFYPMDNLEIDEKMYIVNKLKSAGATNMEINLVRKMLSKIRGGNLARLAYPAKIITLIMSDTPSSPLQEFAGGPTVYMQYKLDALKVLQKYNIEKDLPTHIMQMLNEQPDNDNHLLHQDNFSSVDYHIIANLNDALSGMEIVSWTLGLIPIKFPPSTTNYTKIVAREYVKLASLIILAAERKITKLELYNFMFDSPVLSLSPDKIHDVFVSKELWGLGLCLLMGGRSMTKLSNYVEYGCPNQELALYFSLYWYWRKEQYPILKKYIVWFLGGNTAGRDENADVSGAYGYDSLIIKVYQRFKNLKDQCEAARLRFCKLSEENQDTEDYKVALEELNRTLIEKNKVEMILPHNILGTCNVNSFFASINNEDELLKIGDSQGYTFTNVGDLHVIRISYSPIKNDITQLNI